VYRSTSSCPRKKLVVSGQFYAPAALPPGKELRYPLDRRLEDPEPAWARGRSENSWLYRDSISGPVIIQQQPVRIFEHVGQRGIVLIEKVNSCTDQQRKEFDRVVEMDPLFKTVKSCQSTDLLHQTTKFLLQYIYPIILPLSIKFRERFNISA
jgi:hypothetical protein